MHDIVVKDLEKHFTGDAPAAFYEHIESCAGCRSEVLAMDEICGMFREMTAPEEGVPEPSFGFSSRVVNRIVAEHKKEAWGLFSPGAVFFRRIAFASLLLLAGLGSFLVTRESSEGGADAAAIMARQDVSTVHAEIADSRDETMMTLASYGQ